jgi:hypothetical protein
MNIIQIQWLRPIIGYMMKVNLVRGKNRLISKFYKIISSFYRHPLTNDDFRKLLMTPAAPGAATGQRHHGASSSATQQKSSTATKFVFYFRL